MEMERYTLVKNVNNSDYLFYSIGKMSITLKVVRFRQIKVLGESVFNVAFGDLNESTDEIDDKAISNNGDRLKILNTVASAIADFIEQRPNAIILAKGSTLSRVRLYQMAISSFWSRISQQYEIYGKTSGQWIPFRKGVNFEEFLLFRKIK